MRPLSAVELLDVWERGLDQPPAQRALALLAAACPDTPPDTLARLSIGQRDSRLLTLREWTFGPQLASLASCPACGERLELAFNVADIQAKSALSLDAGDGQEGGGLVLDVDGYRVNFRLPDSLDLEAVSGSADTALAREALIERCLLAAYRDGQSQALDQLPASVMEAVIARMAQADPQADVQLALACPACGHGWQASLDIVSFFWSEINAWAYRILGEVHVLASAYGWSEADILAQSPWRRQVYLDMVGG